MAVQFHKLTVADVQRETSDTIAITFDVPDALLPVFQYKQGQYLTVRMDVDGVSHRRNYSLCSSPFFDEPLTIAVKRVNDGVVSSWLNVGVKPGDVLEVYPPMGNFTKELNAEHTKHYVLFGGGSGITPLMSMLKSIIRVEPSSQVQLFYANRDKASVIFSAQLEALELAHPDTLHITHILESDAYASGAVKGLMDVATATALLNTVDRRPDTEYFVCGPTGMMDVVLAVLKGAGIDDKHIHREYFTIDKTALELNQADEVESKNVVKEETQMVEEVKTHSVTIKLYGKQHTFDVHPDETILSAAQRENLDPPYACQIGACCTCRARVLSGKVVMDEREALSDDEMAEGYVLTCQSHPVTSGVVADYDQ
ncbi:MAG: ferredoxin--NADP reductase [bacterium]|nr:ferredoxin--NADP reductase [bacterium]